MPNVLITGARAPVALHLARLFAHDGYTVFAADCCKHAMCRSSKAVKRFFLFPSPANHPLDFAASLSAILEDCQADLLVPCCEEIFYIAHFKKNLPTRCRIFCDDFETLRLLHNKYSFLNAASDCGASIPETHLLESVNDAMKLAGSAGEFVFKPVFSRSAARMLVCPSPTAFQRFSNRPFDFSWIAQRFISGKEICTHSVVHDGELVLHCAYLSSFKIKNGAAMHFVPIRHDAAEAFVCAFAEKYKFSGHLAFDFIEDRDGGLYVIECNPRPTSGVFLFNPGEGVPAAITSPGGSILRPSQTGDVMLAWGMVGGGLPLLLQGESASEIFRVFCKSKDIIFNKNDWSPFFYQLLTGWDVFQYGFKHGLSLLEAATADIDWNGNPIPEL